MAEIPAEIITAAAEVVAQELRKVSWIIAPPERIRSVAFDVAERALAIAGPRILAAERARIAAELDRRADGLDSITPADTGATAAELQLMATTLRNTAWVITHDDQAVNLRERTPGE